MKLSFCIIGISLLFSSFYMHFLKDDKIFNKFTILLNDKQKEIYKKIFYERLKIYLLGVISGLFLGLLYQYNSKNKNICIFLTIIFITKLVIYKIHPKSDYMLYHLDNQNQVNAWTDIYVHMKTTWIKSIILGVLSYIFINYGIFNKNKFE